MSADYTYWHNALKGQFGPVHDGHPQPGYYRCRESKGGKFVPVAIWADGDKVIALKSGIVVDADEVWLWCCENPISEELYHAVHGGAPWPDDATSPRNSNNPPPEEVEADEIESAVNAALAELKTPVTDQLGADRLGNHRDLLAKLYKAQDQAREKEKRPHLDANLEIEARFKPKLAKIEDAGKQVKAALTKWLNAEDARIQKENRERLAAEEAERRKAQAAGAPPPPKPAEPVEPERPRAGTMGRTTALRTFKRAEITNMEAALKHFADNEKIVEVVQALANAAARNGVAVPGCTIIEEKRAA